jgi:hypothetical protein
VDAVTAPPAPAVAPPLPYRYAGKVITEDGEKVLLAKGEILIPIKPGDTLDGAYKVEAIGPELIELVYLPLGTRERVVATGALQAPRPSVPSFAASPTAPSNAAPAASGPALVRWEGPERVEAGSTFSVVLRVNTAEPLRSAPMQLRFRPDVLEPLAVRPGKFFDQGNFSYRINPEGSIFVGASSPSAAAGNNAELVVLTFRPIKRGATGELTMSALSLQGAAGRAIAHEQLSAFRVTIH